ncbi:MAG: hypothetical protein U5K84_05825 [Alkalibacterium sp.]|nr:hypothetical protein [Alkalibacterium sp.]
MNRKQRILNYVNEACTSFSLKDIEEGMGITTKEVSDALDTMRSNVSKDLNQLVREGELKKIDRPASAVHPDRKSAASAADPACPEL